jgi:hypothetical protein
MKRYVLIFILGLLFSCKKDKADPEIPAGALFKITASSKLQNTLEYNNGKVSRVLAYSSCDSPYSTVEYGYSGDQVAFIRTGSRGLLSSWSGALCDPNLAFDYYNYTLEYDAQGRPVKVTGDNFLANYEYDGRNATVRMSDKDGNLPRVHYLKFDDNGNIIEKRQSMSDSIGLIQYEYDNSPNPMRGLNSNNWPDPFTGPNNVVRAFDAKGQIQWERKFTYDSAGRPLTCDEGNGVIYEYFYR